MKQLLLAVLLLLAACKSKEEILNAAEEKGKTLAEEKARLAKGIGEGLSNEGKGAAEAVGKGVAEVMRGTVKGVVDGASTLPLEVAADLSDKGIRAQRAALHEETVDGKPARGVKVYLLNEKPFTGDLTLLLLDQQGLEIGRSKLTVDEKDTNGRYAFFAYDARTDLSLVQKVSLK